MRAVNMVQDMGTGEIAVKRHVSRATMRDCIVEQLDAQLGMVCALPCSTGVTFLEPQPFNWIVLPQWTHVMTNEGIVRDHIPLIHTIPQPSDVFHQFSCMIHQRIVNRNDPLWAVTGPGIVLQPRRAAFVQHLGVLLHRSRATVQARLIGRDYKFTVDPAHSLGLSYDQAGRVYGKVAASGRCPISRQDPQRILYTGWHGGTLLWHKRVRISSRGLPSILG